MAKELRSLTTDYQVLFQTLLWGNMRLVFWLTFSCFSIKKEMGTGGRKRHNILKYSWDQWRLLCAAQHPPPASHGFPLRASWKTKATRRLNGAHSTPTLGPQLAYLATEDFIWSATGITERGACDQLERSPPQKISAGSVRNTSSGCWHSPSTHQGVAAKPSWLWETGREAEQRPQGHGEARNWTGQGPS